MRSVIQRVTSASVSIGGAQRAAIGRGLLLLVGVGEGDTEADAAWLAGKVARMRIFPDDAGLMNRSVMDIAGGLLAISQFTLFASTAKGNRPSFFAAAKPELAEPLYQRFVADLQRESGLPVGTGVFAADMQVALINDGPVTIIIDSRQRE